MKYGLSPVHTNEFVKLWGADPWLQEDAHEFFLSILSKLDEERIDGKLLSSSFRGIQEDNLICPNINFTSSRDYPFLDIGLNILVNETSLICMLRRYFEVEVLNSPYQTPDHGPQEAWRSSSLTQHPNILVLHIKRFVYDVHSQEVVKVSYTLL